MTVQFAENLYSFRSSVTLVSAAVVGAGPDAATLAAIEATMEAANEDFWAGRYQDAITAYNDAAASIYGFVDPHFPRFRAPQQLSVDTKLFDPILSASLEYMNILPLNLPDGGPVSRIAVDPSLLKSTQLADQTGVRSTGLLGDTALSAYNNWQLAQNYAARGLPQTSAYFEGVAKKADPQVVETLEGNAASTAASGRNPTAGTTPVTAIAAQRAVLRTGVPISVIRAGGPSEGISILAGGAQAIKATPLPSVYAEGRTLGAIVAGKNVAVQWPPGGAAPVTDIKTTIYAPRINLTVLPDILLQPIQPSDFAVSLPHILYYSIPLGLAECYHALGDYQTAEQYYIQAANYQYINLAIEAPYVWLRMAQLYLDWDNSDYINADPTDALTAYTHVIKPDDIVPAASPLYTIASFAATAATAKTVIASIKNVGSLPNTINPNLIAAILEIYQQLVKLNAGLDYWGHAANYVPIWTFDYLQSVAINFAQLAMSAEHDFINYQQQSDNSALTRLQLQQTVSQSTVEVKTAKAQAAAAQAEADAYQQGLSLATLRASDSKTAHDDYQSKSWGTIEYQAESTANSGGDDGNLDEINADADALLSGPGFSDTKGFAAAAAGLAAARLNRDYELGSMQRNLDEMNAAQAQAQAELTAANARVTAANAGVGVAQLRAQNAQQMLGAFDSQYFTPDVWQAMANVVYGLYLRYFAMALKAAKLMQIAYNFETDQTLNFIRNSYSSVEIKGLLGADQLMADIQSFTYDLITSKVGKPQPIKQTISLAERYPYAFETQFRVKGAMDFETRIEDFEEFYPGTYAGRIDAVEVTIDGIVPVSGISGTLTNGGISMYRMPSWSFTTGSGLKYRIQKSETLVLSDYSVRNDSLLQTPDQRMLRVFEGAGTSSSWHLDVPPEVNDIDYGALIDVRLTFYYKARFDPDLKTRVIAHLDSLAGAATRMRGLPLRWLYPDAFFHFINTGTLAFALKNYDFRRNETKPQITNIALLSTTDGSIPSSGLNVSLATPGHVAPVAGVTDATGVISSGGGGAFTPLATGNAIGPYTLAMTAAGNPSLVKNGKLALGVIANIAIIIEYTYTPKS